MERIINKGLELRDKLIPGGGGLRPRGMSAGNRPLKYNLPSGLKYPLRDAQGNTQKLDRLGRTSSPVDKLKKEPTPRVNSAVQYKSELDQPRAGSGNKPGGMSQRSIEGIVQQGRETILQRQAAQKAARHAKRTGKPLKEDEFEERWAGPGFAKGGAVRSSRDYGK